MQSIKIFNEVSPRLADRLKAMPKAEIHVHIEGATSAETYYQIAQKNQIDLPVSSKDEWQSFFQFRNFAHFIEVYVTAVKLLPFVMRKASVFKWRIALRIAVFKRQCYFVL
jgi:adenosine deaminase